MGPDGEAGKWCRKCTAGTGVLTDEQSPPRQGEPPPRQDKTEWQPSSSIRSLACVAQCSSWLARFDSTTATFGPSCAMGLWDVLKRESRPRSNTEVNTPKPTHWIATNFDAEPLQSRELRARFELFTENLVGLISKRGRWWALYWLRGLGEGGSVISSRFTRSHTKSANGAVISADRTSKRVISSIRLFGCVGPLRPHLLRASSR